MKGVYLIHFAARIGDPANPRGTAGHYLGWASDIAARLRKHKAGKGAALMAAVSAQGVAWQCVRRWECATRQDERRLHRQKNSPRLCPVCRAEKKAAMREQQATCQQQK